MRDNCDSDYTDDTNTTHTVSRLVNLTHPSRTSNRIRKFPSTPTCVRLMCEDARGREVATLVISVEGVMDQGPYQQQECKVNNRVDDARKQAE